MCPFISCGINLNVIKRYVRQNQKTDGFVAQIVCGAVVMLMRPQPYEAEAKTDEAKAMTH